jgi:PAS domain S-box-containing protein
MKDEDKTKQMLIQELVQLRQRVIELEQSETDRKQIKDVQREKNELQTFLDSSPLMVWCKDKDGRILFANRHAAKAFGCSVKDILTKCCYDFHPNKEADKFRKDDLAVINSGKSAYGMIEKYTVPSGEERWALTNKIPYRDEDGNIIGVVVFVLDITEHKRTEQTLLTIHSDMEMRLNDLTSNMISVNEKLQREIVVRKSAEDGLIETQKLLRNVNRRLEIIREEERKKIALEMHDELGQILTVLQLDLAWLSLRIPKEHGLLIEKVNGMEDSIRDVLQSVKRILSELRPPVLDEFGIVAAVEWQAKKFQNRTGIECTVTSNSQSSALDWDLSTTLFRIMQECLTNIARHANATEVRVDCSVGDESVKLIVGDNGRGITQDQISDPESLGLIGMRERLHPLNGTLTIKGAKGQGTIISVSVPVKPGRE